MRWAGPRALRWLLLVVVLGAAGLLTAGVGALAQSPGEELKWWTVAGGGSTFLVGGGYELGSTVGQADAGLLRGGGYELAGGFWVSASGGGGRSGGLYLPLVSKNG
ncbi:MAG: hypothetical protein KatS3mg061_2191 [Dehalococcoidia bacterium]|nr:MAG: hypothetical protein KatS3mg061_2191 [Dehalococcoidia bacterium]